MKRSFDIVVSTISLVVLVPVFLSVMLLVRLRLGNPIFFSQMRPGRDSIPFKMIKFRTMRETRDSDGNLLADADRLTALGRFLRSTSLDELPELWNVLKGDMSLVGPRPLLMEYLPLYSPMQARRHEVRPGITGWAQINGRNAISWEEKFALDVWYVDNRSVGLDMKIMALTLAKVFGRADISARGEATMPRFTGSRRNGSASQ
ncbi:MAG: sugar transferase [Mesorhizobium sp. 61-13]|nr:sugar transferase [Mesorhizobium sp.]OJU51073.1 MAG: sugar transferase [Mesorhizobium sp. 61-13]